MGLRAAFTHLGPVRGARREPSAPGRGPARGTVSPQAAGERCPRLAAPGRRRGAGRGAGLAAAPAHPSTPAATCPQPYPTPPSPGPAGPAATCGAGPARSRGGRGRGRRAGCGAEVKGAAAGEAQGPARRTLTPAGSLRYRGLRRREQAGNRGRAVAPRELSAATFVSPSPTLSGSGQQLATSSELKVMAARSYSPSDPN